jgi:two-component system, OmpR family, sensor histidine kinase KdpD
MADNDRDRRPSADALLALTQREQRGRLKVFLGAAPGVGKTYAMLQAARARKRQGVDVVAAVVETHSRADTQALLEGVEMLPRRDVEYRGTRLTEMDLDAVLTRHPQLVLVDELAHTNASGSRHPKRYLDVDELLAAGIDVYTTVNIQHLESLNDTIAQITGVRVRETLPDRVLEKADDVQVIDLPPEELIQRLNEGKVYVPEQATRAIQNYFRAGNLNALRELALRRTADRVDVQMRDWMKAQAVPGPWPTKDRIMVCVSPSPTSDKLVRATKRRADRRNAEWMAVFVETPAHEHKSESERDRVAHTLRLTEQLGGEAVTIPGRRPADDLIQYAQSRNVSEIIIGKSMRSWWQELRHGSLVGDLIRKSGVIDVYVIHGEDEPVARHPARTGAAGWEFKPGDYVTATAVVAVTALCAKLLQYRLSLPNLTMVFLLGVLFCAVRYGLWVSLYASVVSALLYNFFFTEPLYTFRIASPQEALAFLVYFIVAVIASQITARMREQADAAQRREIRTNALFKLSRAIAAAKDLDEVARTAVVQIADILRARVVVLVPASGELRALAVAPDGTELSEHERAAATWSLQHALPTGNGTDTLPGIAWSFLPMATGQNTVGVLGVQLDSEAGVLPPRRWRLMEALADQAAVGLERARLRQEMEQARLASETDKLHAALLSSISHDLRTPLASIIGSSSSLIEYGKEYDERTRDDLLQTVHEEAERLNRFVGNLLDINRLESGRLELKRDWAQIEDVIGSAIARLKRQLVQHRLEVRLSPQLPLVRLDFVLMEQVLVNLLDNAVKYSPSGTLLTIKARQDDQVLVVEVVDEGTGVPQDQLEQIFDKFYRVRVADRQVAGTGLGLSICRGIVEAHGGKIQAGLVVGGKGLVMSIRLPMESPPQTPTLDQVVSG